MIHIKDDSGKDVIKPFYYSQFENSFKLKYKIYNLVHNKENMHIFCDCCKKPIELKIAKLKRKDGDVTIYLKNAEGNGEKHSQKCKMFKEYKGTSKHELGWTVIPNENGNITYEVNPSKSIFKMDIDKPSESKHKERNIFSYTSESSSDYKVTLLGLATKLNMIAWLDYQNSSKHPNEMPSNIYDFQKQLFGSSQKIKFKGKRKSSLQDYWFNHSNANTGDIFFIIAPLSAVKKAKYPTGDIIENMVNIHMSFMCPEGEYERIIQCEKALFNLKKNEDTQKKNKDGTHNTMVCGFVKKYKKYYQFESIEFFPIIPEGLWIESSYEKEVYSKLIQEKILFSKPFESPEYYNGYIPDIIFTNSKNKDKPYIGEIFGIENDNKYIKKQEAKIKLASESKNIFDLWFWEPNKNKDMPKFY